METKTITYIEEGTFESAMRMVQERVDRGDIRGAMAMLTVAEALEEAEAMNNGVIWNWHEEPIKTK